jgi:dephospho-CoA kinase
MLKIGLTGGIGSGKSTVAKVFEVLGIPVYYADDAAKRLMNEDEALKQELLAHFGKDTYINGVLNRAHLSKLVFNNKEKLELLNSFVHPATVADATQWFSKQSSPYVIKEAALLFESGTADGLDRIIGVHAPETLRIKRVMDRDNVTAEEVKRRMNNQMQESIKMKLCDYIIENNEQQAVLPQVLQLHQQLSELAVTTHP